MDCPTHEKHELKCLTNKNDFTVFYMPWSTIKLYPGSQWPISLTFLESF